MKYNDEKIIQPFIQALYLVLHHHNPQHAMNYYVDHGTCLDSISKTDHYYHLFTMNSQIAGYDLQTVLTIERGVSVQVISLYLPLLCDDAESNVFSSFAPRHQRSGQLDNKVSVCFSRISNTGDRISHHSKYYPYLCAEVTLHGSSDITALFDTITALQKELALLLLAGGYPNPLLKDITAEKHAAARLGITILPEVLR